MHLKLKEFRLEMAEMPRGGSRRILKGFEEGEGRWEAARDSDNQLLLSRSKGRGRSWRGEAKRCRSGARNECLSSSRLINLIRLRHRRYRKMPSRQTWLIFLKLRKWRPDTSTSLSKIWTQWEIIMPTKSTASWRWSSRRITKSSNFS